MLSASEVLSAILGKPTDLGHVRSLGYHNPDLRSITPWCGTHRQAGPESIVRTFVDVGRYWNIIAFEPDAVFGEGEYAAMFGRFTYRSTSRPGF